MIQRLRQASRDRPMAFYTFIGFVIFGAYGLIFRSAIDQPYDVHANAWVATFVFMIKLMLIVGPVAALVGLAINQLFVTLCGMAVTAINCLAYGGVFLIVFFPQGGGFVIGGFIGMGVGLTLAAVNLVKGEENER
jgi:hypothetical protein